jgi:hypothetical protein
VESVGCDRFKRILDLESSAWGESMNTEPSNRCPGCGRPSCQVELSHAHNRSFEDLRCTRCKRAFARVDGREWLNLTAICLPAAVAESIHHKPEVREWTEKNLNPPEVMSEAK